MKILSYWPSRMWQVLLDEGKVQFHRKLAIWHAPKRYSGWAYKSNQKWFAVYRDDGALQFRCDEWICTVNEGRSCELIRQPEKNLFLLKEENTVVFQHEYKSRDWGKDLDPTYDEIDAEGDDFFLWLSRLWGDSTRVKSTIERLANDHLRN